MEHRARRSHPPAGPNLPLSHAPDCPAVPTARPARLPGLPAGPPCPPARLPACPPARLPACPSARLPACPPARLPACPPSRLPGGPASPPPGLGKSEVSQHMEARGRIAMRPAEFSSRFHTIPIATRVTNVNANVTPPASRWSSPEHQGLRRDPRGPTEASREPTFSTSQRDGSLPDPTILSRLSIL